METRIEYARAAPGAVRAMYALESYVAESDLEASLLELVKLRASQINGCAYCVDMHARDARVMGESEPRLYTLSVWRETPFYTDRERAALAWTEAVTEVGRQGVGDQVYRQARAHFPERDLVDLTLAIIAINGWNRLAISFRPQVGSYSPGAHETQPPGAEEGEGTCVLCGEPEG